MPGDDVGHIAGEKAIAILLGVQQPKAGPGKRLGTKRKASRVKRRRDDAERRQRAVLSRWARGRRQETGSAKHDEETRGAERERRGKGDHAPRCRERRLERRD